MTTSPAPHVPVLLREVIEALAPSDGGIFIDGTFGAGGYTRAILDAGCQQRTGARPRPDALFVDATAVARSSTAIASRVVNRAVRRHGPTLPRAAGSADGAHLADGVVLDLGVSSMQLDQPERGFSFQTDGPLDMRMSQSGSHAGRSAADLVNTLDEEDLADILYVYGEEKKSRWHRQGDRQAPRRSTVHPHARSRRHWSLACSAAARATASIRRRAPSRRCASRQRRAGRARPRARRRRAHPEARRAAGRRHLPFARGPHRQAVPRRGAAARIAGGSRHLPEIVATAAPSFQLVNPRPLTPPEEQECAANPRARSAKLRAAVRTTAAPLARSVGTSSCRWSRL